MKLIPLSQGQVAVVDSGDYEALSLFNWYSYWSECTGTFYAIRNCLKNGKKATQSMHRQLMGLEIGDPRRVDHINPSKTLDNRRSVNLRIATPGQNQCNQRKRRDNTSGIKGVGFHKQTQKWRGYVSLNGKQYSAGLFNTKKRAAFAVLQLRSKLHGEFARTA